MEVRQNYQLKKYNTFGIKVCAKYFASFSSVDELQTLLSVVNHIEPALILGGGSNLLFTKNFDGLVLKNEITGISIVHEDEEYVYIKAGAGEGWHKLIMYCIDKNLGGIENLSLIPGSVGASPMQNIGAYGVELKDVFYSLEAYHLKEKNIINFTLNDCEFRYRDSVFKRKYKDELVILTVTFRLAKKPIFNISYGAIKQELEKMNIEKLSIQAISKAVINIRSSKLPDPAIIGNAGSFFKNPEIDLKHYHQLKENYPDLPGYQLADGNIKLAAGWLVEQCGWKGYRKGDAGCYSEQALVLVNYGNASGEEIYKLSEEIKHSVLKKFNVTLEREVNIV